MDPFENCKTADEVAKVFRSLSKNLHPDTAKTPFAEMTIDQLNDLRQIALKRIDLANQPTADDVLKSTDDKIRKEADHLGPGTDLSNVFDRMKKFL